MSGLSVNLHPKSKISNVDKLLKRLLDLPVWVKQYFYFKLREDLCKSVDIERLDNKNTNELVQMYIPTPSAYGQRFIRLKFNQTSTSQNLSKDQLAFLKSLGQDKKLIDICNEHKWSLMKCSKILVECIEQGLIESIENNLTANTIYYLAGRIRLGEYLLRMNKISLEQVDRALYTQKEISIQMGQTTKIGELLVNLGFIKESDKNDILNLKEHCDFTCDLEDDTEKLKTQIIELQKALELHQLENEANKQNIAFYQEEFIDYAQTIANLQQEIITLKQKKNFLNNIFNFKLVPKRA